VTVFVVIVFGGELHDALDPPFTSRECAAKDVRPPAVGQRWTNIAAATGVT
jgi:hypothetical protein